MTDKQTFVLRNRHIQQNALKAVQEAPEGYSITIAPKNRSNDQNAMFHAICSEVAKSGHKFLGKPRSASVWKVLFISGHAAATDEGSDVVPGLEGEFVNIRESSALMSMRRAASLITYTLAYCDTNGIPLTETRDRGFIELQERAA